MERIPEWDFLRFRKLFSVLLRGLTDLFLCAEALDLQEERHQDF